IVLAIVLVVQDRVGRGEPGLEQAALGMPLTAGTISPLAPAEIGVGEIVLVLPDPLVDQRLQTGAVGSGLGTEDAVAGPPRCVLSGDAGSLERPAVGGDACRQRVGRGGLVERGDG